jgi:hypothetical protein
LCRFSILKKNTHPISERHLAGYTDSIKLKLKPRLGSKSEQHFPLQPSFVAS